MFRYFWRRPLVPERGRPSDKPFPLPKLGLNAQALRFLDFPAQNTITAQVDDVEVTLPHPANFALHKLLVLSRRPTPEKQAKDKEAAVRILRVLLEKGEEALVRSAFNTMPPKWQTRVKAQLAGLSDKMILNALQQ